MAFHFQKGKTPIDLAAVYHASLSSVEEIKAFQDMLLTGDVKSIADSGTGLKEGLLMSQMSAQYLHYCKGRLEEKISAYESLIAKKEKDLATLAQFRKVQERKRRRLKQTDAELDDRIKLLKALVAARGTVMPSPPPTD